MIKISIVEIKLSKIMWQRPIGKRPGEKLIKRLKTEEAYSRGEVKEGCIIQSSSSDVIT